MCGVLDHAALDWVLLALGGSRLSSNLNYLAQAVMPKSCLEPLDQLLKVVVPVSIW